jgi:hypothetical protein
MENIAVGLDIGTTKIVNDWQNEYGKLEILELVIQSLGG